MVGISGVYGSSVNNEEIGSALVAMNASQVHRGPDEGGVLLETRMNGGLACRRLGIVDPESGQQPVSNEDGTIHVVFNGKIYNHRELREWLQSRGHCFRSRCDTEVIAHLFEEDDTSFLDRLHGMFALVIMDTRRRRFFLARDGAGMKPLYYCESQKGFLCASEAGALFATGWVTPQPNPRAMDTYLSVGYVPSPISVFRGIKRLRPGQYLIADQNGMQKGFFWRFHYHDSRPPEPDEVYVEALESILDNAVRTHLASDVPVGAFVSGGWDSSLMSTMAARHCDTPFKTFSIVFPESPMTDESKYSRLMARRLGTEHHEIEYRAAHFLDDLPRLSRLLEEPFDSGPAGVILRLASFASGHVKAVISGQGADELFGGYEWLRLNWPYFLRKFTPRRVSGALAKHIHHPRLRRGLLFFGAPSEELADVELCREFAPDEKSRILKPEYRASGPDIRPAVLPSDILSTCQDSVQRRLAQSFVGRLPDGILFVDDRLAMAYGLELRLPFLDRSVIDFALRLPSDLKISGGQEKVILSKLARRLLPAEVAARRKQGLTYPPRILTKGAVARAVREMLMDSALNGPFEKTALERMLTTRRRSRSWEKRLSRVLSLQSWWNEFMGC